MYVKRSRSGPGARATPATAGIEYILDAYSRRPVSSRSPSSSCLRAFAMLIDLERRLLQPCAVALDVDAHRQRRDVRRVGEDVHRKRRVLAADRLRAYA